MKVCLHLIMFLVFSKESSLHPYDQPSLLRPGPRKKSVVLRRRCKTDKASHDPFWKGGAAVCVSRRLFSKEKPLRTMNRLRW